MKPLRLHLAFSLLLPLIAGGNFATLHALVPARQQDEQQGPRRRGGFGAGSFFGSGSGIRGTVTAINGDTVTVKTEEGEIYKVATGPNSHLMKDRQPIKATDIKVGDVVLAGGEVDQSTHTLGAVFLAVLDPEQVQRMKQAQADFGKTWTAGKVTAIHELVLTIERPDKQTQTITVDENTSFRKHRDSITLGDIQVGDTVTARGALKSGSFLATNLSVVDPNQRSFGGPRNGSAPPQP